MRRPRFEPVSECVICGNDFYESEMVMHYKLKRLVDRLCADEPTGSDYLEKMQRPVEKQKRARQPVPITANGYDPAEWSTAVAGGIFPAENATVVGDTRMGVITATATGGQVRLTVTYGTPLAAVPSTVRIIPYSPTAQPTLGHIVLFRNRVDLFEVIITATQAHVTYQWRYEVVQ